MTHRHSSKEFAAIICLLYSIPPTPAVLASPYTEPLFALFTFLGFDLALRRRYLLSALSLAAATSVRATGVLGAVVVCWLVVLPRGVPTSLDFRPTVSQLKDPPRRAELNRGSSSGQYTPRYWRWSSPCPSRASSTLPIALSACPLPLGHGAAPGYPWLTLSCKRGTGKLPSLQRPSQVTSSVGTTDCSTIGRSPNYPTSSSPCRCSYPHSGAPGDTSETSFGHNYRATPRRTKLPRGPTKRGPCVIPDSSRFSCSISSSLSCSSSLRIPR